jgi:Zn-dependent protease
MNKLISIGKIKTSRTELVDISKAWMALSLAFAFVYSGMSLFRGGFSLLKLFSVEFGLLFLISLFTAGIGFLLHELAHKFVAQHYGAMAEFRAFDQMLYLAVGLAVLIGFIFAAPGAVMISGMITRKENGIVSLAGPLTNYVLAGLFFSFVFLILGSLPNALLMLSFSFGKILSLPLIYQAPLIGIKINMWLGLFNMIPFGNFDGLKIMHWNRYVWGAMVIFGIVFVFFRDKLIGIFI